MMQPQRIMDLVLQSVENSDLFESDLEKEFVKNTLQMALEKGDFPHFVEYYGQRMDFTDYECYFKKMITKQFDEDVCKLIAKEIFDYE